MVQGQRHVSDPQVGVSVSAPQQISGTRVRCKSFASPVCNPHSPDIHFAAMLAVPTVDSRRGCPPHCWNSLALTPTYALPRPGHCGRSIRLATMADPQSRTRSLLRRLPQQQLGGLRAVGRPIARAGHPLTWRFPAERSARWPRDSATFRTRRLGKAPAHPNKGPTSRCAASFLAPRV
jgi:hypothetical protein